MKVQGNNAPRKGATLFVCLDATTGEPCGLIHYSLREAIICTELHADAAERAGKHWDSWPHRVEERPALEGLFADPCLNGGPSRDHAADQLEVVASIPVERREELGAAAARRFPAPVRRVRRVERRRKAVA
jgi:hypothetical protein